jgi:hypothetical protein
MKKLVLLIILLLSIKGFSQHPELLDKEWFLYKFVIEEEDIIPPTHWEVGDVTINFTIEGFDTSVCSALIAYTTYEEDTSFFIDEAYITAIVCQYPENQAFDNLNQVFFTDHLDNDFYYEIIIDINEINSLLIYNANGDEAHYGSVPLSQPEFSQLQVTLYPNPVSDVLYINSMDIINKVSVYDIQGKVIKTVSGLNSNTSEINLSSLQNGVYFISVVSENGEKLTRKVVKK